MFYHYKGVQQDRHLNVFKVEMLRRESYIEDYTFLAFFFLVIIAPDLGFC